MKLKYILLLTCLISFACGGGDDLSEDFLDAVPSEAPNVAWNGDWTWEFEVSESDCPGLAAGNTDSVTGSIQISEGGCETLFNTETDANTVLDEFRCEMGGNILAAHWKYRVTLDENGQCVMSAVVNEQYELDESNDQIDGILTGEFSLNKECPIDADTFSDCSSTVIATATPSEVQIIKTLMKQGFNLFDTEKLWDPFR